MKCFILLLALLPAIAVADPAINVTREQWRWSLVDDQNVPIKDTKGAAIKTDTLEQCDAEGVKYLGRMHLSELRWRCTTLSRALAVGVCTGDNPEPPKPIDDDGFTVFPEDPAPEECPPNMPNPYRLLSSKWVVEYPTCGEYKPVETQACGYVVGDDVPLSNDPPAPPGRVGSDPAASGDNPEGDDPTRP